MRPCTALCCVPLRDDLPLRGLSERTREMDVRAIHQLAAHDHQSPARITEEARRASFLSRKNVKHSSRSASTIARCGITFFYEPTLKRAWSTLTFVRAPREQKLPVILSVEAVRTILAHLKLLRSRVCLTTIYACGLRLQAGTHLQVPAIDRARMLVPGRYGTGATDRSVPWPTRPLALLRQYWPTPRNPVWLFPAPGRGGIGMARATAPRPRHSV
jgi:integrase